MTTGNTSLLGLALPVEGELDGTWGDVVNDSITSLVDSAVAGTTTLSADSDVTLTDTALAANQARQAIILWTASNGATTRNITAPARSKAYAVINAGTGSIVLRGAGPTTGVTIVSGERCVAAWNGSDFVKVASSVITALTGTLPIANGGTGATSFAAAGLATLTGAETLTNKTFGNPTIVDVNSSSTAFRITQVGTGNALLVEDSTNPDATPFVVDSSGAVIAGYTSRFNSIDAISLHSAGASTQIGFSAYNWNASGVARLNYYKSNSNTIGTYGAVVSGNEIARFGFWGDDGTAFVEAARIGAAVDGTPGTNDMPGRLVFSTTADGASSPTERMRLTSAGFLGLGTNNPVAKFDLAGDYKEGVVTANTGTAYTINTSTGTLQILTLTGNCTFTFPTATTGESFTLFLRQDGTGGRTVTWPANVRWPGGTAPTITSTASRQDKYIFTADGTNWYGSNAGQNYTV